MIGEINPVTQISKTAAAVKDGISHARAIRLMCQMPKIKGGRKWAAECRRYQRCQAIHQQ